MASLQKIALYLFFDAIESDLILHCRKVSLEEGGQLLNQAEREKARENLSKRDYAHNLEDDIDLLHGLDIGEKYDVLLRHRNQLPSAFADYIASKKSAFDKCISVRNSVMHGRPLTIDEYALGFALGTELLRAGQYWPNLREITKKYKSDPAAVIESSTRLLQEFDFPEILNNLPAPDYDDTGFFPRQKIERDLKKKILGRHPVVTVLGDGGNGKTAVTLQTLYGLLSGGEHEFDAIIWVSAKSSRLTTSEIKRIEGAITSSFGVFGEVAHFMQEETDQPIERVKALLEHNKILLVIDNLETILDQTLKDFASDVPGQSKLLLTSRVPLGSDLTVVVGTFSPSESVAFLRRLASAYNICSLRRENGNTLKQYAEKLNHRPLLLKWFALGVLSGLEPAIILQNSTIAIKFVLENVFESLSRSSKRTLRVLAALPKPASIAVLDYVSKESTEDIEVALAELMRFTIVEQDTSAGYEVEYRVKPIAKAYLVRVLGEKLADLEDILTKYRRLEAIYQSERAEGALDRYNPKKYVVRSQSEALAAGMLRRAVGEALMSNFEESLQTIEQLKRSNPDYFEVWRAEAFVSFRVGDLPRAQMAYETALELDPEQNHPQLYHFYGGFLIREFNDFKGGVEKLDVAMQLDPDALPPLVEAARARMFMHDFDEAQKLISAGLLRGATNLRSETILFDLQLQNYGRRFDVALSGGNARDCIKHLEDFSDFISKISFEHLDGIMVNHIRKYQRLVPRLREILFDDAGENIRKVETSFEQLLALIPQSDEDRPPEIKGEEEEGNCVLQRAGKLKRQGLQENFGFIRDENGDDTFVHNSIVSSETWGGMLNGLTVFFDVEVTEDGKTCAVNVRLKDQ